MKPAIEHCLQEQAIELGKSLKTSGQRKANCPDKFEALYLNSRACWCGKRREAAGRNAPGYLVGSYPENISRPSLSE